ncbi:EF-hand domain-containing protein [Catenuloplanes japonicus]|uniref:EF-hand domain-containing protein n=1 Tax=Catenuloplanes japonicus TaxID=33876 RepID=UPI0005262CBC|nr:EF-hand domain-containing protein [Catenuloplanes japonicus]
MSATATQKQRLEQRFQLWDANGDGAIDRSDYEAEAHRILKSFQESPTSPKGAAVVSAYQNLWKISAEQGGIGQDGSLDPEAFQKASEAAMLDKGDAGFDRALAPTIQAVADLCDEDGDGQVDRGEFARWINAIGVEADPIQLFNQLDTNGSGTLTTDELVQAVKDYHAGNIDVPLLGR